jgi:nitroreductase
MKVNRTNPRVPSADVDAAFPDRWSPRSFSSAPLPEGTLETLIEAARWSPSCFNEQPWRFLYALKDADRARFVSLLSAKNRTWAERAPLLLFVAARRTFTQSGAENRWACFDVGAAWMALALQARRLGLHAHAMAGFARERAHAELGVPVEQFDLVVAIAVGRRADASLLPEDLASRELPGPRRPVAELAFEGHWPE